MGMMIRRRLRIRNEEGTAEKVVPVPSVPEEKKVVAENAEKTTPKNSRKRKNA